MPSYLRGSYNPAPQRMARVPVATKNDVYRLYRQVKALKPELKYVGGNLTNSGQGPNNVSYVTMSNIDQGTSRNGRIGSTVQIKKIQVRGRATHVTTNFAFNTIFVLRGIGGAVNPVIADFETTTIGVFPDPKKFQELYKFTGYDKTNGTNFDKTIYLKRPIIARYTGATGVLQNQNEIFLVSVNPAGGNIQNLSCSYRLWFNDH